MVNIKNKQDNVNTKKNKSQDVVRNSDNIKNNK